MRILDIRPHAGARSTIGMFDLELTGDVRLFNLRLVEMPVGRRRVFAPSAYGTRTPTFATFSPHLVQQIVRAASAALGDESHHDRISE